jgi:isoquinoline 1-oxidoreductase beta subunit
MSTDPIFPAQPTRRAFLRGAGTVTAMALTIGFEWAGSRQAGALAASPAAGTLFVPNAFLRIGADNSITVIAKHVEMGQGAYTGIATIVAEELDADWTQVRVESAPADASRYYNTAFGKIHGEFLDAAARGRG